MKFFVLIFVSFAAVNYVAGATVPENKETPVAAVPETENLLNKIQKTVQNWFEKLKEGTYDRVKDYFGTRNEEKQKEIDKIKEEAEDVIQTCQKQTGISSEDILALRNGDFLNREVDETSKKFVSCYLEGLDFLNNGNPQINTILKKLGTVVGNFKVLETFIKCRSVNGDNPLDKTFNVYTCFFKNKAVILD